jgi:hypothetical protein
MDEEVEVQYPATNPDPAWRHPTIDTIGGYMKCLSILVMMFMTVAPTRLSFGQAQTSTPTPQTSPNNKKVSSGTKPPKKADKNSAKTDKPGGKMPTTTSQEAAYDLSGHKGAPEGAPHPKQ